LVERPRTDTYDIFDDRFDSPGYLTGMMISSLALMLMQFVIYLVCKLGVIARLEVIVARREP
jgi:hypothetical protein